MAAAKADPSERRGGAVVSDGGGRGVGRILVHHGVVVAEANTYNPVVGQGPSGDNRGVLGLSARRCPLGYEVVVALCLQTA